MNEKRNTVINIRFFIVLIGVLLISFGAYAQPIPCKDPFACAGGCKPDGITCWDVDDPVPLDNGLLILVGAALIFGFYKLKNLKPLNV